MGYQSHLRPFFPSPKPPGGKNRKRPPYNISGTVHEEKMENKCSKCDFATLYQCKLKEHVRAVHDKIKDKLCHVCDARFAKTENLKVHIQSIHDKTKSFQCSFCT